MQLDGRTELKQNKNRTLLGSNFQSSDLTMEKSSTFLSSVFAKIVVRNNFSENYLFGCRWKVKIDSSHEDVTRNPNDC